MANFRMDRVNSELQRGIAEIINQEMNNPLVDDKIVSVLSVETAKDLSYAKVMIDVMGSDEEAQKALKAIQGAQGFIKRQLKEKVVLHNYPALDFRLDKGYRQGNDLITKIDRLNNNE